MTTTAVANVTGKFGRLAAVRYINIGKRDRDKCQRSQSALRFEHEYVTSELLARYTDCESDPLIESYCSSLIVLSLRPMLSVGERRRPARDPQHV